ncbi:MAG TPA: hypothetical protein VGE45_00950 [Chloroflexia bacterium]|jgi:hypothetical protein
MATTVLSQTEQYLDIVKDTPIGEQQAAPTGRFLKPVARYTPNSALKGEVQIGRQEDGSYNPLAVMGTDMEGLYEWRAKRQAHAMRILKDRQAQAELVRLARLKMEGNEQRIVCNQCVDQNGVLNCTWHSSVVATLVNSFESILVIAAETA